MTPDERIDLARHLICAVVAHRSGISMTRAWRYAQNEEVSSFWLMTAEHLDRAVGPAAVRKRKPKKSKGGVVN